LAPFLLDVVVATYLAMALVHKFVVSSVGIEVGKFVDLLSGNLKIRSM
jgi:hypothetical protein